MLYQHKLITRNRTSSMFRHQRSISRHESMSAGITHRHEFSRQLRQQTECSLRSDIKSTMALSHTRMGWTWGDDVTYRIKGLFPLRTLSWDWIIVVNSPAYSPALRWWWSVSRLEADLPHDRSSFPNPQHEIENILLMENLCTVYETLNCSVFRLWFKLKQLFKFDVWQINLTRDCDCVVSWVEYKISSSVWP